MKRILLTCFMLVSFLCNTVWAQDRTVSGKVTSADDGSALPGVNVVLKGTGNGTTTDIDGNYKLSVPADGGTLQFSFIGMKAQEIEIGARSVVDVTMSSDVKQLQEVVVTALGIKREERTLPYANQEVKADKLNMTQTPDFQNAIAGKVAGVQINGQAGSKLGAFGKIRIRGAISLTNDSSPLYIVDGVPVTDPNNVDMNNIASINVLKGPNATALYGQRAESGVVVITTKKGEGGVSVEVMSSTVFSNVSYLPEYQNKYGQGYDGAASMTTFDYAAGGYGGPFPSEWQVFDGKRIVVADNNYADESWGAKFDGKDYVPWYAWWPDSPYFGQTAKWESQPNNIRDFYQTGVMTKNTVAVSQGNDNFNARLSYTNLEQKGITPYTSLYKNYVTLNLGYNPVEKLHINTNIRYTHSRINGNFDDGYGNQTSGSFNSWFNRQIEMDKMKELADLKTFDGYSASWNWWGPNYYTLGGGFHKPAFWFNHFTLMKYYKQHQTSDNFTGNLEATYNFTDQLSLTVQGSRNQTTYNRDYYFPFYLANSAAPELYNSWSNSFGNYDRTQYENNLSGNVKYQNQFNDFDVSALIGANVRQDGYSRFNADMPVDAKTGGLIIPDVYTYSNAGIVPTPDQLKYKKQVNSLYGNVSFGYKGMAYIDASYRKDWSSALPSKNNGYGYPSIGGSFVFSELMDNSVLSFGKLRAGWAQVGSDVDALRINPVYPTGSRAFMGTNIIMNTPGTLVDPNLKPALNTSFEAGFDLKFFLNRVGLNFTYYNESRKDDIIPISVSRGTGYTNFLTNAGETRRKGVEIALNADIFKNDNGFNWSATLNFAKNKTTVEALPGELKSIVGPGGTSAFGFVQVVHELGSEWGQLRGAGYKLDNNGNKVLDANGLYVTENDKFLGSVLPDFTGGFLTQVGFKGLTLGANIDFQKGGHFFSLSDQWGNYSGLYAATAETNDNGKNVRDAIADGGGVHVTGVSESGSPVDMYVPALDYYKQFIGTYNAEPYVHGASFVKLRELSLTYDFSNMLGDVKFIKHASIGVVGRNLALLAVSKDNINHIDPSELSQTYGEDGQLPSTRSYGVNVNLKF